MSGLLPLSVVVGELELLAGQAEDLAADLGVAIVPGWRGLPSVATDAADLMAAEMTARREKAQAELAEAIAGAREQPARGYAYAYTDLPGHPAFQHQPRAGRLP
jgi:hypothetical protein